MIHQNKLSAYLENPKQCKQCSKPILPTRRNQRVRELLVKSFCNSSCAGSFNAAKRIVIKQEPKTCPVCGIGIKNSSKACQRCYKKLRDSQGEVTAAKAKSEVSRAAIAKHARSKKDQLGNSCIRCGYDKHVEVCHIKAVMDFAGNTLLAEINHVSNLMLLCPNCHWEFDHKLT